MRSLAKRERLMNPNRLYGADIVQVFPHAAVVLEFEKTLTHEERKAYAGRSVWFDRKTMKRYQTDNEARCAEWRTAWRVQLDKAGQVYVERPARYGKPSGRTWVADSSDEKKELIPAAAAVSRTEELSSCSSAQVPSAATLKDDFASTHAANCPRNPPAAAPAAAPAAPL